MKPKKEKGEREREKSRAKGRRWVGRKKIKPDKLGQHLFLFDVVKLKGDYCCLHSKPRRRLIKFLSLLANGQLMK